MRILAFVGFVLLFLASICCAEQLVVEINRDGKVLSTYREADGVELDSTEGTTNILVSESEYAKILARGKKEGWKDLNIERLKSENDIVSLSPSQIAEKKNEAKNNKNKQKQLEERLAELELLVSPPVTEKPNPYKNK